MGETHTFTRILIVEDNQDHSELIERALFKHNSTLKIETTSCGTQCWVMLGQGDYDAVLLDYTLPKIDGLEVLKGIRERGIDVPIIMVTGQGDERIAVEAMKLGAYDYITKSGDYLLTLPFVVQKSIERHLVIKEKEKLDQEVKETKDYLENFLENANDIIYTLDMDGRITYVNQKAEEYGTDRQKLVGKNFFSLLDREQSGKKFKESILEGTTKSFETTFENCRDDSREKQYFLVSISLLKNQRCETNGISGIARDVTETKRLEQKQHEMEIELMEQHKLSSIGTMIQGIAHNMNSPLTGILGRIQLLERRLKKQKERLTSLSRELYLKEIDEILEEYEKALLDITSTNENVDKLAGMIKNMMYKSRQEQTEELQLININELLREELAFLEANMFFKHDVTKEYNLNESIPFIKAVYSDFSQSIMNIITNALDAMYYSEKKKLTVTTRFVRNHIDLDIHDTGIGIKEEHLSKIFDPFFTTKPTNSNDASPSGIGLGLHSCYILLKKYNVRIEAKSGPGDTTFTLRIPVGES